MFSLHRTRTTDCGAIDISGVSRIIVNRVAYLTSSRPKG
jgi:hypothetical protein